jgi:hypothetical protein
VPTLVQTAAAAAAFYGLNAAIFNAMIEQESSFRPLGPDELSSAGAGGIGQFMPATWTDTVDRHPELVSQFGARRDPAGRFDPIAALYASAAHLSDLLRMSGDDYNQALGAYYAGFGRRNSDDGRYYASIVMARTGATANPTPTSPSAPSGGGQAPLFDVPDFLERVQAHVTATREELDSQVLGPVRELTQPPAAAAPTPAPVPTAPAATATPTPAALPASPAAAQAQEAGFESELPLSPQLQQVIGRIRAIVQARQLQSQAGAALGDVSPVQRAQLGAIIGGVARGAREVGSAAATVLEPISRPIFKAFEIEEELIGDPLAKAAVNLTPLRFLPKPVRGVTEEVLSTLLVPSTVLLPLAGRAITVGSVLGRFGLRALANPTNVRREYESARIVLRSVFPNQTRLAAQVEVANRFAAAEGGATARRVGAERIEKQLTKARADLQELVDKPGATKEIRGFGRTLGTIDEGQLRRRVDKLEKRLEGLQQRALSDVTHRLENIAISADPAVLDAVNKTEDALQNIAKFNQPSRFSPTRLGVWRKNVTGFSDEMEQSYRWLIPDLAENAPAHIREAGDEAIANWRASLEWIYNLGAEGAFDPKAHPGTIFNFAIRASEPLRNVPLVGKPAAAAVGGFGRFIQPLGSMDQPVAAAIVSASRYRRAALHHYMQRRSMLEMAVANKYGKGLNGEQVLVDAYRGTDAETRAGEALARYTAFQQEKGITFDEPALADMVKVATAGFKAAIGTVEDSFRNPRLYELDDEGLRLFRFVDDALTSERDTTAAMGVSIGRVKGDYLPQRRIAGESMNLGTSGRVTYARSFKTRQIEEFDDFIFAAAVDGAEVDYDIARLLDTRLGQSAEKKSFQVIAKMLASNPDTERYVERPLLSRVKGPLDTQSDDFKRSLVAGLNREMNNDTAEAVADQIIRTLPNKLSVQEAEFFVGREFRLRSVSEFTEQADKEAAQKIEAFFRGGRTVPVDENFVGRSLEAMRSMLLSMDVSPLAFVQGARLFAQDPISYMRAIGSGAAWQMTQHGRRVWAVQNAPTLRYWANKGLQLGHPMDIRIDLQRQAGESMAAWMGRRVTSGVLPPFDWLNNEMMHMVGTAKMHIANTTHATLLAAQQSPEVWGVVRSLPMFKSITQGSPEWRQLNPDDLGRAVASGLNNYIGPVEFAQITAEGRPSLVERLAILTPSWTRGNIGLLLDAPKLGNKGVVTRHLFMNQLAVQAALSTKLSLALGGRMPEFDPTATDFMAVQTPDFRFQLFPTMSAFRLPFRTLAGRPEEQRLAENSLWQERLEEFTRFFEGRMAQGPRIAVDLLQGEDFLGRKIDAPEQFVVKELMPIIAQELWESIDEGNVPPGEIAQRAGLEFAGAQVLPKTPFQLYRERSELLSGVQYEQLTSVDKRRLEQQDEELRDLRARQQEYRARRGDSLDQFFNMTEENRVRANEQISTFLENKQGQPGFLAEYAALSGTQLATLGELTDGAIKALFDTREEFEERLKGSETAALDEVARRYWAISPEDFVDLENNRWTFLQAFLDVDPDSYRDQLWRAFRETREAQLSLGAEEFGLSDRRVQEYVLQDWPSVRWRDPRASELEVRRVAAQRGLDQVFEESPYRFLNGDDFSPEQVRRVRDLRVAVEQMVSPMRAMFQAGGGDMPDGTRRTAIARLMGRSESEEDRKLLLWMMFWDQDRFRTQLRNPDRDVILVNQPDIIKFYPERVRFLLSTRLLQTPLGDDPEVVRIVQNAVAR